jgi:hypothetical protein
MISLYTEDTYVQICLFSPLYTDDLTLHWRHLCLYLSLYPFTLMISLYTEDTYIQISFFSPFTLIILHYTEDT